RTPPDHRNSSICARGVTSLERAASQRFLTRRSTKSRQLQEKPHSLSYHATTLTQFVPTTCVYATSTIAEFGFPRKSIETSSSSLRARMPFIGPSAALRKAALTLSAVVR